MPAGDPIFDPEGTGTAIIPFGRAIFDPATGTSPQNPRQQLNQITGFIDGSMVYGSDPVRAAWHCEGRCGRLRVMPRILRFKQITSDPAMQDALRILYGNVNDIDPFVGCLA